METTSSDIQIGFISKSILNILQKHLLVWFRRSIRQCVLVLFNVLLTSENHMIIIYHMSIIWYIEYKWSNSPIVRCSDATMHHTQLWALIYTQPKLSQEATILTFCRCGAGLILKDLQSSTSPRISTSKLIPPLINMRAPQLATAIKTNAINKLRILYTMFSPFLRPF